MSNAEPARPRRAFVLEIEIGGDTWDDVMRNFHELAEHIPEHGPECSSVSGSPSCGHHVIVTHSPEMTHERYIQDLEAWIAWREQQKTAEATNQSAPERL